MHITLGKVTGIAGAREHLDVHGRAHCGAGSGRTIAGTRWAVDGTLVADGVCRRCLQALRARLAEAAAAGDQAAADAAYMLEPADPRRDAALLADIRAHLTAVHTPDPTPAELAGMTGDEFRRRLLADLRA